MGQGREAWEWSEAGGVNDNDRHLCHSPVSSPTEELRKDKRRSNNSEGQEGTREQQTDQTVNGQEMAEGSSWSGSEIEEMEEKAGGKDEGGNSAPKVNGRQKRKKQKQLIESSLSECTDTEQNLAEDRDHIEKYKVYWKLDQDGISFGEWNPIQLTKAINNLLGDVKSAKVMHEGSLLIFCKDGKQQGKAAKINKIGGRKVQGTILKRTG